MARARVHRRRAVTLVQAGDENHTAAVVLLRCLAVPGLVPEPNYTNQIGRLAVEVCESPAPQIVSFLKLDKKLQTYEKFEILRSCHLRIVTILKPLSERYRNISSAVSARKEIMGALNHGIVREYCGQFRLNEIRSVVEFIFAMLQQILQLDVTLLSAITECERRILGARSDFEGAETFLSEDYLKPFLDFLRDSSDQSFFAVSGPNLKQKLFSPLRRNLKNATLYRSLGENFKLRCP